MLLRAFFSSGVLKQKKNAQKALFLSSLMEECVEVNLMSLRVFKSQLE